MIRERYEPGEKTTESRPLLLLHIGNERQRKRGTRLGTRVGRWYPTLETVWWWGSGRRGVVGKKEEWISAISDAMLDPVKIN